MMKSRIPARLILAVVALLSTKTALAEPDIEEVVDLADNAVHQITNMRPISRATALLDIAKLHGRAGDHRKAQKTLHHLLTLLKTPQYQGAFDVGELDLFTVMITQAQARYGDLTGALKTAHAIVNPSRKHHALLEITTTLAETGGIKQALSVSRRIPFKAGDWKAQALSVIAEAQADAGDFAAAGKTVKQFDQVQATNALDRRVISSRKSYSLYGIAVAQAGRGRFRNSFDTTESIKHAVLRIRTLRDVAEVQAKRNDHPGAKRTLKKALRIAEQTKAANSESIVDMQLQVGDIEAAIQTTSNHLKGTSAGCAKLRISIACSKAGKQPEAKTAYEEGLALIRANNRDEYTNDLESVAVNLVQANQLDRALAVAREIGEHQAHARRLIVEELLKKRDLGNAIRTANSITGDFYHRCLAFRAIALSQAKNENAKAKKSFAVASKAAKAIPIGGGTDVIALYELGRAQRQAGFTDDASKTFARARRIAMLYEEVSYIAGLFEDVARAQAAAGDVAGALASARSQSSPFRKARSLLGVAEGMLKRGRK